MDDQTIRATMALERAYNMLISIGNRRCDPEYHAIADECVRLARRLRIASITQNTDEHSQAMPEK